MQLKPRLAALHSAKRQSRLFKKALPRRWPQIVIMRAAKRKGTSDVFQHPSIIALRCPGPDAEWWTMQLTRIASWAKQMCSLVDAPSAREGKTAGFENNPCPRIMQAVNPLRQSPYPARTTRPWPTPNPSRNRSKSGVAYPYPFPLRARAVHLIAASMLEGEKKAAVLPGRKSSPLPIILCLARRISHCATLRVRPANPPPSLAPTLF